MGSLFNMKSIDVSIVLSFLIKNLFEIEKINLIILEEYVRNFNEIKFDLISLDYVVMTTKLSMDRKRMAVITVYIFISFTAK